MCGNFVDSSGNILGRHKGVIHYTIGQRKGLGIAAAAPLYVCDICPNTNEVVLGSNEELFRREGGCYRLQLDKRRSTHA